MHKDAKEELRVRLKLTVLEFAKHFSVTKTCKEFNVPRSSFYRWKQKFEKEGRSGLYRKKPIPLTHPLKTSPKVIEKILKIRKEYQIGALRIKYYLERYYGIKISESTVTRILRAHKVSRLPKTASKRTVHSKRYAKTVPGHHVQVDVKFLKLKNEEGKTVKRFQYTAVDDATRIRALQIYPKHNQNCAIKFIDYVIEKFPFRINTIRTDRGHEFQARFHWHVEDQGMQHSYIKPRTPQHNGKVERSHRTDQTEFYQLLTYTNDIDLNSKLKVWESFYNYDRPHISHDGKTPFEVMRSLLK
ncbi:MAG: IS481 family transposase [Chloroflexi bacterium]|jgi:transposase InsO family protein|nr:IS481 family transposase [Chloroflexota bacterium]MBT4004176.1 IS481 family transposase [Chloroflexota bacterium]MBT4306647.1 IS481 family transposase [Chloroflexota bacterium]MBT4533787.1 IS481 family transposase [Chloroflexota bacterium]MBT4681567.1 IS481 family transposase [Chloroflexota bacterium]